MRRAWILAAAVALAPAASAQPRDPASQGVNQLAPDWLTRVEALGLPKLPGPTPAWYVPGKQARARELQALLADQAAFYRDTMGVDVDVGVAVLDPETWPKVKPYGAFGMPSVSASPHLAVMPDDWDKVAWFPLPKAEAGDPALVAEARTAGVDWDRGLRQGADLIITHEFGHTLMQAMNIDARSAWFNEFLATYVGYAFVKARRPQLVVSNRLLNLTAGSGPHPHTSLRYLDANLGDIAAKTPANYAWYQGQIFRRVEEVYARDGLGFLQRARTAFVRGGPQMNHDAVLDRLEAISPGFKAWAASLEAQEPKPA